jgi:thiamine-phosphate pyrophosphorylase
MARRCLLYYITDRSHFPGDEGARRRALLAKISEAAVAGVDYIQLREKDLSARDLEALAREALSVVVERENGKRTRFLINSRTDVALAAGADGVHLRSVDMSPSDVREVWRSCGASAPARAASPIIAVSSHLSAEVFLADSVQVNFAVFAPVFGKKSVAGTQPAGIEALREACAAKIPVLALGGVTIQNAASCLDAGAAGVAGIRLFQENKIADVVGALWAL